jgi:fructokinase
MATTAKHRRQRPTVAGLGLVALDVIVERGSVLPALHAGGTCANVLTILSYLGWRSRPIARLGADSAADLVRADLRTWGVDLSWTTLKPSARTPIIVQKIRSDRNGIPFHTFTFFCPDCGARFPGFQPVTAQAVRPLLDSSIRPDVFFVDRISKSALTLAETYRSKGTVIVFEPQRADESKLFKGLLAQSSVVKYSHERIDELAIDALSHTLLEVQTLGRGGIRFRIHGAGEREKWLHLQAEPVAALKDAAGSGDWLTAGLIHSLWGSGRSTARDVSPQDLQQALNIGQRLAAWNCSFVGARGGMYSSEHTRVFELVDQDRHPSRQLSKDDDPLADFLAARVCARCIDEPPDRNGAYHQRRSAGPRVHSLRR